MPITKYPTMKHFIISTYLLRYHHTNQIPFVCRNLCDTNAAIARNACSVACWANICLRKSHRRLPGLWIAFTDARSILRSVWRAWGHVGSVQLSLPFTKTHLLHVCAVFYDRGLCYNRYTQQTAVPKLLIC